MDTNNTLAADGQSKSSGVAIEGASELHQVAAAAIEMHEMGFAVVPLLPRQKRPIIQRWTEWTFRPASVLSDFAPNANIGIILGARSRLIDVDVDCDEAAQIAAEYLPPTPATWGRASRRFSHRLYRWNGPTPPLKFSDPFAAEKGGRAVIIELRGDGSQSMCPPSIHPDDGPLEWDDQWPVEPAPASYNEIAAACAKIAAQVVEMRHGAEGRNHPVVQGWLRGDFRAQSDREAERPLSQRARVVAPPIVARSVASGAQPDASRKWALAALADEARAVASAANGARNATLNNAALKLGHIAAAGHLGEHEICAALTDAALSAGLGRREIVATIRSGLTAGLAEPRDRPQQEWSGGVYHVAEHDAASQSGEADSRDEPLPLSCEMPPSAPFPVDSLGPFKDVVEAIARSAQAPISAAANSVMTVAATSSQHIADVETLGGGSSPISLFCISVLSTGDRKSTVDKMACAGVKMHEDELRTIAEDALKLHRIKLAAWQKAERDIKADKNLSRQQVEERLKELGGEPEPPLNPEIVHDNATIEGLLYNWKTSHASAGWLTAEGAIFAGGWSMRDENRLQTFAIFAKIWSGENASSLRVSGKTRVVGKRLAMHLMMQSGVAREFLAGEQAINSGFLARFLVAFPETLAGTREYKEQLPEDIEARERFARKTRDMLRVEPSLAKGTRNELKPPIMSLTGDARRLLVDFYNEIERELSPDGKFFEHRDVANRAAENAARIAAIMTLYENHMARAVDKVAMQNAITIVRWYLDEIVRIRTPREDAPAVVAANKLLEWLRRQEGRASTLRDLMTFGPLRNRTDAVAAINALAEYGHVTVAKAGRSIRFAMTGDIS